MVSNTCLWQHRQYGRFIPWMLRNCWLINTATLQKGRTGPQQVTLFYWVRSFELIKYDDASLLFFTYHFSFLQWRVGKCSSTGQPFISKECKPFLLNALPQIHSSIPDYFPYLITFIPRLSWHYLDHSYYMIKLGTMDVTLLVPWGLWMRAVSPLGKV